MALATSKSQLARFAIQTRATGIMDLKIVKNETGGVTITSTAMACNFCVPEDKLGETVTKLFKEWQEILAAEA